MGGFKKLAVDGIVGRRFKFSTPAVETEIHEFCAFRSYDGEESVVACPSVVGGALEEGDVLKNLLRELTLQKGLESRGVGMYNEQRLSSSDFKGKMYVGRGDFGQHVCPVRILMRPSELNGTLGCPLGRERALMAKFGMLGFEFFAHGFEVYFTGHADAGVGEMIL